MLTIQSPSIQSQDGQIYIGPSHADIISKATGDDVVKILEGQQ